DAMTNSPQKSIFISCVVKEGMAEVVFHDTGPGIPEGLEQRVFDPFFTTKEMGAGTGLGLSIVSSIIKDHQGTISMAKGPDGQGAAFLIRLPLAPEIGHTDS